MIGTPSRRSPPRPPSSTSTSSSATSRAWRRARRDAGVRLRPHAKTHKCPEIAQLQRAAGAWGLSLAKVGEAEVFVAAGFDDLFVAYPAVGEDKGRRLLRLADRARAGRAASTASRARARSRGPFRAAGRTLDVLLKVDVGYGRVGVLPERAARGRRRASRRCPGCACAASSPTRATATSRRRRARVDEIAEGEGERSPRPPASCATPASRSRRCRSARRRPPPSRCAWPASRSAAPATTCSTTPRRWRSGPAASRTARSRSSRPS